MNSLEQSESVNRRSPASACSATRTQKEALEYIIEQLESHPMFCSEACDMAMRGDYSGLESADDADTAITSELSAVARLALGLPSPNDRTELPARITPVARNNQKP